MLKHELQQPAHPMVQSLEFTLQRDFRKKPYANRLSRIALVFFILLCLSSTGNNHAAVLTLVEGDNLVEQQTIEGELKSLENGSLVVSPQSNPSEALTFPLSDLTNVEIGETQKETAVPIVESKSTWKFFDRGVELPPSWKVINYDDSDWPSGQAEFGYGDNDESTTVGFGENEGNKHPTTYFRKTFLFKSAGEMDHLKLELLRDDGAIVYLNGLEIARSNMPEGATGFHTRAQSTVGGEDESKFFDFKANPKLLIEGDNILAVEVHQSVPNSSDLGFDLRLSAVTEGPPHIEALVGSLGQWTLETVHGGTLSGLLVAWTGQGLKASFPFHKEPVSLDIPKDSIRQMWRDSKTRDAQAAEIERLASNTETVFVQNTAGQIQSVSGRIDGVEEGSLLFHFRGADRKINFDTVVGVVRKPAPAETGSVDYDYFHQAMHSRNGQVLPGRWLALSEGELTLETMWGHTLRLGLGSLNRIEMINGRLRYLSDLEPKRVEQVPFLDRIIPFQVDRSLYGEPIRLGEDQYKRGISMHSKTVMEYDLNAGFNRFLARLGMLLPEGKDGNARVRVLGDGKELFSMAELTGGGEAQDLEINVKGVRALSLEVDFGQGQDVGDHVAFANARLIADSVKQPAEN